MPNPAAFPIRTLREHATALEAAISVCLSKPKPDAVHKVRTQTRRIEAQLELLRLLKKLPSYRGEARKVLRQLKKLRRAAGQVRDLDIAQKLVEEAAEAAAEDEDSAKQDTAGQDTADLRKFRKQCKKSRKRGARRLLKLLAKRQTRISVALEDLLNALKPAEDLTLPVTDLVGLVEQQFGGTHALIIRNPSTEHLHSIRKAAKLARYMAENAAESPSAARLARRYEAVQEAGGEWHDWLQLAEAAADELGEKHAATVAFTRTRERRLATYRSLLDTVR